MGSTRLPQTIARLLLALLVFGAVSRESLAINPFDADCTLLDVHGRERSLSGYENRILVVAFLGVECPLAKLYGPRLQSIQDQFGSDKVVVVGIDSNSQDSLDDIARYVTDHRISFAMLKDLENRLADALGAKRTPEVFVFDEEAALRYRGRIDDQFGVGSNRSRTIRQDLVIALTELLRGEIVSVSETEAEGCLIGRVATAPRDGEVTYAEHIAPLLNRRCVECHRAGEIAPFELTEYEEVAGWAPMIEEVVMEGRMPPWHASAEHGKFDNDRRLTDQEKQLIARWVADGAPSGDLRATHEVPAYVDGWQLPKEPDLTLEVQSEPFEVPEEGEVKYQWFEVDPAFTEDRWVKAAELVPGNRAVVHHILAFLRLEGASRRDGGRGYFAGYAPGARVQPLPKGYAVLVPAGAKFVFQVHYTPNGTVQHDKSRIGLIFADTSEITHRVLVTSAIETRFEIPAGDPSYEVTALSPAMPVDVQLISMAPHMHLRGKSFRYTAEMPDGVRDVLLDIPNYDFNWQTSYRLVESRQLPAGTKIRADATFDNSASNPNNPDPERPVRWGDQTWDEMMIGYFAVAVPLADGELASRELR